MTSHPLTSEGGGQKRKPGPRNDGDDPHAHECYTCEYGPQPPVYEPCVGCINRDSRPHWVPKAAYADAARAAITKSLGGAA